MAVSFREKRSKDKTRRPFQRYPPLYQAYKLAFSTILSGPVIHSSSKGRLSGNKIAFFASYRTNPTTHKLRASNIEPPKEAKRWLSKLVQTINPRE